MAAYLRLAPNSRFVFEYRIFNCQGTVESVFTAPTIKPINVAIGYRKRDLFYSLSQIL